eukprot:TRINITY_DN1827_c0_g1_i2.p1 TRINITY_DN1827_c0_g1~~TRINITY_DN1827_c0_g1_i2.p1  ORF type:complete len:414 (-),score=123.00 TRINITY_DN1827_c0_g1_i2:50-1291(-)
MEELNRGVTNAFRMNVIGAKDIRSPIKLMQNTSFIHIRSQDVYLVAVTKHNVEAVLVFEILYKIAEIFRGYFGGKLDEEAIKNHLTLTYEILDEIMDYGYAQNLSLDTLKAFIFQKGAIKPEKIQDGTVGKITSMVTGACPWRNPDTFHKKNELYIDVVESVNLLVATDGKKLRADVSGSIQIKCLLSGMPECKFGLNDKLTMDKERSAGVSKPKGLGIAIDDCTFHTCVRLSKFDTDRTISFVPPDGEFELMKYRTTENIEVPFTVTPIVKEHSRTRLEVKVAVKSNFKRDQFGTGVTVKIPLPKNTALVKIHTQSGKGKYRPEEGAIVWKIRRFPGETKYIIAAEVELAASVSLQKKAWSRPPISMEFQVPMFTASGLHVRFLKVLEMKQQYQAIKWVRYLTQAGNYQYRI